MDSPSPEYAKFEHELTKAYEKLFAVDARYSFVSKSYTPQSLAAKMTAGLASKTSSKDSDGVKTACKAVGIKHTWKEIIPYLN